MNRTPFFEPPNYNAHGRQQLWIESCSLSHDTWCGCSSPALHLLASLLPPGHKDRDLTIEELIQRQLQKTCHSGGAAATASGITTATEEEDEGKHIENLESVFSDTAIDELLAAAAADVEPR